MQPAFLPHSVELVSFKASKYIRGATISPPNYHWVPLHVSSTLSPHLNVDANDNHIQYCEMIGAGFMGVKGLMNMRFIFIICMLFFSKGSCRFVSLWRDSIGLQPWWPCLC